MQDKPHTASAQAFNLPGHTVLALRGRDAIAFAQSQFMNDVNKLADHQWQWSGWLSAKGRVLALFALLRMDAQTLWLLLPDVQADALAQQLQRFVFRSKLSLSPLDTPVSGMFAPPSHARSKGLAVLEDGRIQLDLSADGGPRTLLIGPDAAPDNPEALARWTASDLAHGLPRLPADQAEQWTPQQLSLERLAAFSVQKGCYPGQEIVARTHFLGQAKRSLALVEADVPLLPGMGVHLDGRAAGHLICSQGTYALAVLPHGQDGLLAVADGPHLRAHAFLGGLAR